MYVSLGRLVARHPRTVVGIWAIIAALCLALATGALGGTALFDNLDDGAPGAPGEATTGFEIQQQTAAGTSFVGAVIRGVDLDDPATRAAVTDRVAVVRTEPSALLGVRRVADPSSLPAGDPL